MSRGGGGCRILMLNHHGDRGKTDVGRDPGDPEPPAEHPWIMGMALKQREGPLLPRKMGKLRRGRQEITGNHTRISWFLLLHVKLFAKYGVNLFQSGVWLCLPNDG